MGIMTTYHGSNNEYNNPMYNAHKNVGAHYMQQNMVNVTFLNWRNQTFSR